MFYVESILARHWFEPSQAHSKVREGEGAFASARGARSPIRFTYEPRSVKKQNAGCRSYRSYTRHFARFSTGEAAFVR